MTIPCIAFSYRNITLFQRDCCVYIYMKGYPLVQELKSYHTQPYSFTSTAVCLEGYFLKGMLHTFERNIVYNCICIYIYIHI